MRKRNAPLRLALGLVATALLISAGASEARDKYGNGEMIEIRGTVTDPNGEVLEGVKVVLEASRKSFRIRTLGRSTVETTRVAADTDATGNYAIRWPWDNYYNVFHVDASVPVRKAEGFELESLVREEITQRIGHGTPVVVPLVVENGAFVRKLKSFVDGLDTHDERAVYERMGKPDKVDRMTFPTHEESTWWYFEKGKTYRFHTGSLAGVTEFDPIEPF